MRLLLRSKIKTLLVYYAEENIFLELLYAISLSEGITLHSNFNKEFFAFFPFIVCLVGCINYAAKDMPDDLSCHSIFLYKVGQNVFSLHSEVSK